MRATGLYSCHITIYIIMLEFTYPTIELEDRCTGSNEEQKC